LTSRMGFEDGFGMCDVPVVTRRKDPRQEYPELCKSPRLILNHPARSFGCAEHGGGTTTQSRIMTHTTDVSGNPLPNYLNHEFQTTKELSNKQTLQAKETTPPSAPRTKAMIPNEVSLQERLDTYMPGGEPPATLSYTLGGTCKKNLPPLYTETTNQHYFETLPTQKREEQPEHFQTDKRFAHTATINRELKSAQDPPAENVNRRRGELTRNPRESGNPYGVSVFVDEYAKWGTQLLGRTRKECEDKACTKHF